ncbi:MAG: 4-hydroxythreonine-4-phosphate dehydrogenase PdxA [Vicinamibacterales bacterium]|nr:4-hydroxythreonine-4-phosphate dehydrogenase PdxA [Vicinamibacterales bacterium]
MTAATLPLLGVTIGDVAGVGPEITAKALLQHPGLRSICRPIAIGDAAVLARAVQLIGGDPAAVKTLDAPAHASNDPRLLEVIQEGRALDHVVPGVISAEAGDAAARYVIRACALARSKEIDGIVTAPLNKEAMHAGGHLWPGHTELLAHEFGVERYSLVLSAKDLFIFHISTHVSLRQAIEALTRDRTLEVIRLTHSFARACGQAHAVIAVAGLNPHAGENRLFGNEDADIIEPAVKTARAEGINVVGPIPADALIPAAVRGKYQFIVVCYHDQGHAPFKAVYGDEGVNITVGLPTVRVSVDHGTAFDIAGTGLAREASLVLAMRRAAALAPGWIHVS